MIFLPNLSVKKPPISAPTAAPKALAPIAPKIATHTASNPNSLDQIVIALAAATIHPESKKFVSDTAIVPFFSSDIAISPP